MQSPANNMRLSILFVLCLLHPVTLSRAYSIPSYKPHSQIPVLVNNIGPFHNPAETYSYYTLPFCPYGVGHLASQSYRFTDNNNDDSKDSEDDDEYVVDSDMGQVLAGDRRERSIYDVRFAVDATWQSDCPKQHLTQNDIKQFIDAIDQHYVFELFVDDLSVRGFVGEKEVVPEQYSEIEDGKSVKHFHNRTEYYLFTHLDFSIAFNGANVIAVNLTTDPTERLPLRYGKDIEVEWSHSVHWVPTDVTASDRMTFHSRSAVVEQSLEIHWLSIINSFVLVILLTAFLAVILMRVLRKDVAKYLQLDDEDLDDDDIQDEVGWKLVHGDVFRPMKNVMLFTAAVGNGAQILVLVVALLLLAVAGTFYPGNRGAVYSAAVLLYAGTAYIAGYVATLLYLQLGGQKWASNALLTACLFALPFFAAFVCINTVAEIYGSTAALPLSMIAIIIALWALVSFPLTILGSLRARAKNGNKPYDAPCKTNRVEREIPPTVWYRHPTFTLLLAGFLPFSAIYIELHYLFAAIWGHRVYTLFGILSLAFLMLVVVTSFITVALTYFQLAAENYKWWWRSFASGASVGIFMYLYAAFYYMYRSEMSGALQATFFFGYMAVVSYAFSLMLGSIAWLTASMFVKHIYRSVKID